MNRNLYIGLGIVAALVVISFFYFSSLDTNNNVGDSDDKEETNGNGTSTPEVNSGNPLLNILAARSARDVLAARLNVDASSVTIVDVEEKEWPDGCLGLPRPNQFCTQALVPGYRVTLSANGTVYYYRTNAAGTVVRSEN